MKLFVSLAAAAALMLPTWALAGVQAMVPCPALDAGCIITCVQLDQQTSAFSTYAAPLQVEFLDSAGGVLGTATLNALNMGQTRANLDTRVMADEVDSIRFYTADNSGLGIGWVMLKVLCDPCSCGCWNTVYKGCLCDWRPTVEPLVEIVPEPEEAIVEFEVPEPPEPVIMVPGRG
jgi:hypothetical protein